MSPSVEAIASPSMSESPSTPPLAPRRSRTTEGTLPLPLCGAHGAPTPELLRVSEMPPLPLDDPSIHVPVTSDGDESARHHGPLLRPPCEPLEPLLAEAEGEGPDGQRSNIADLSMTMQGPIFGAGFRFRSAPTGWDAGGGSAGGLVEGRDRSPCRITLQTLQDMPKAGSATCGRSLHSRPGEVAAARLSPPPGRMNFVAAPGPGRVHVWRGAGSLQVVGAAGAAAQGQAVRSTSPLQPARSGARPVMVDAAGVVGGVPPAATPPHMGPAPRQAISAFPQGPRGSVPRPATLVTAPQMVRIGGQSAQPGVTRVRAPNGAGSVVLATHSAPPIGCGGGQVEPPNAANVQQPQPPDSARGSDPNCVHL